MEDQIIQRARSGDQLAFQQLLEIYNAIVWRTARVLLPDRAAVEDVIQEVWLDVWRGLPRFQIERPFRPWLLAIVANRCRMALRRHQFTTQPLDGTEEDLLFAADDVLEHMLRLEKGLELQFALKTLSIEQQRVLELRFFADLDLSEIALVTNTPPGTVKSRLHRALNHLRLSMRPAEEISKEGKR